MKNINKDGALQSNPWPVFLDRFEQVVIVVLFTWLAFRIFESLNPFSPFILASEGLIVLFTLLRRPSTNISLSGMDWTLAFVATTLPLLIDPSARGPEALSVLGVLLFLFGVAWQLWAKLVLRRSFGIAPANRGVKVGGPPRGDLGASWDRAQAIGGAENDSGQRDVSKCFLEEGTCLHSIQ